MKDFYYVWTWLCSLSVFCAEEFDKETGQILSGMDKLPPDLKQYVKEDNELFDKEIQEWDALQARKAQQEKLALAAAAAAASSTSTSSSSPQPMSIESSPPDNAGQGRGTEYWVEHLIENQYLVGR